MNSMVFLFYFFLDFNCLQGIDIKYLGCFNDEPPPNSALPYGHETDFANSPERCAEECYIDSHRYFGLQASIECWCGDSGYDRYGPAISCFFPCPGDPKQTCGAIHVNSVYEINLTTTAATKRTTTTAKRTTTIAKRTTTTAKRTTTTAKRTTTTAKRTTTTAKRTITTAKGTTPTTEGTTIATTPRHAMSSTSAQVPNDVSTTPHHNAREGSGVNIGGVVAGVVVCATVILVVVLVTIKCKKMGKNRSYDEELEHEPILRQSPNSN